MFSRPLPLQLMHTLGLEKWKKLDEMERKNPLEALLAYRGFITEAETKETPATMGKFLSELQKHRQSETEMVHENVLSKNSI